MQTYAKDDICPFELCDEPVFDHVRVREQRTEYIGPIFTVYNDEIEFASGDVARRQYMDHHDAVAIVALREPRSAQADVSQGNAPRATASEPEILLIRQYRHASRRIFWEIPAGLKDHEGECGLAAAQRELAEEADLQAEHWEQLVSFYASPGCSNENLDIFVAHGVTAVTEDTNPAGDFERVEEEREIVTAWFPLSQVYDAVRRGDLRSPTLVLGVLALHAKFSE